MNFHTHMRSLVAGVNAFYVGVGALGVLYLAVLAAGFNPHFFIF
jgi:hypothetical protein